jgi:SAM-dependent methyltransferase
MAASSTEPGAAGRLHSAPADRNTGPIAGVLERLLPSDGSVLEIASGTGQHVVAFATAFPGLRWQPSEIDPELRRSIALRTADAGLANVAPPIALDVTGLPWPVPTVDAVLCINMIHISPWRATIALFEGAGQALRPGGLLVTYGPYQVDGQHTAPSNEAFDASLRTRDAEWGIRDVADVRAAAEKQKFRLEHRVAMPANNFVLVFRK